MLFIIYSATDSSSIENSLGLPEYSYYFVLKEFRPMLEGLGRVELVKHPETEVDALFDDCQARGEPCIFLSFSPPHKTLTNLRCPTIPVFAWEFDTIPNEVWDDEPNNDWTQVLGTLGRAITHSQHTVATIRRSMGEDFPVLSVPSPVWDRFTNLRSKYPLAVERPAVALEVCGSVLDSATLPLQAKDEAARPFRKTLRYRLGATKRHTLEWYRDAIRDLLPAPVPLFLSRLLRKANWKRQQLSNALHKETAVSTACPKLVLDGIIYTTVLNPLDGRKNWQDMITAFCSAFSEEPDATLVLKFTCLNSEWAFSVLAEALYRQPAFKCRVIGIHGFLENDAYEQLIAASSFTVNSSLGEGQCLPLMEFMACGKPAVAPLHTAMEDYIDDKVAFIVRSGEEPSGWPHDTRMVVRAHKNRIDWASLRDAYRESYRVARQDPTRYLRMASQAMERMRFHASHAVAQHRIAEFLGLVEKVAQVVPAAMPTNLPDLPRFCGLYDASAAGWFNTETGELVPGFTITPEDIVVDVGCGTGGASLFCARNGASVYYLDVEADKVAKAAEHMAQLDNCACKGIVSNSLPIPLEAGTASKIIAMEMLEHVDDPAAVIAELVRIGRPDSLYLISVPGSSGEHLQKQFADPVHFTSPNHVRIFSEGELEELLENAGLVIERHQSSGFYWVLWMCFFWAVHKASGQTYDDATLDRIAPPYSEVLDSWADTWMKFLKLPTALPVKQALDDLLPKSHIIIARKP